MREPSAAAPQPFLSPDQTASASQPWLNVLGSRHFLDWLAESRISLAFTTYQAGKLVMLRAERDVLNTHFAGFNRPMGLAVSGDRLAIGTALEVWEYHNLPAVACQREPVGQVDACFLPRHGHVTGDIHIHEMAWVAPRTLETHRPGVRPAG